MRLHAINPVANLRGTVLSALALLFALTACSDEAGSATSTRDAAAPKPVRVVVTNNIVADWVENVGGDHVEVFSLLPVGADPHAFQPGAKDVAKIADADLVLGIGLGLEESWLRGLVRNAARDESAIVELGDVVDPIEFGASHAGEVELLEEIGYVVHEVEEGEIDPEAGLQEIKELIEAAQGEEEEDGEHAGEEELPELVLALIEKVESGQMDADEAIEEIEHLTEEGDDRHADHGHGIHDPHFWFDPLRVKRAVADIAARLAVLDPDRGDVYRANASAYSARLDELHAWTEEQIGTVPEERRLLVTSHDSLGYFAELYGFEVVGVILSFTTDANPSPSDLAHLVDEVKEYGVPRRFRRDDCERTPGHRAGD